MKLRLASVAVAFVLVGAACGDQTQSVATVNGDTITADFMASLRASYQDELVIDTERFRDDLSRSIFLVAIAQEAETQFGITPSEAEIDERLANPPARWQGLFAELAADTDTTEAYSTAQAELTILRDEVAAELIRADDGLIETLVRESPEDVTVGCLRHVLVDSEAAAEAVIDRLDSGEEFVTVANEVTLDTASGSQHVGGCPAPFAALTVPVAQAAVTAPLNEVFGPVQSEFGFHVLLVEQRVGPPTVEEVMADPIFYLPGEVSSFFTPWFNEAVRGADISVADNVGRWSTAGAGIIPPGE